MIVALCALAYGHFFLTFPSSMDCKRLMEAHCRVQSFFRRVLLPDEMAARSGQEQGNCQLRLVIALQFGELLASG